MKLTDSCEAFDLALYTQNHLIISDVHIGFEEALNKQGIFVPRDHFKQLIQRMEGVFEQLKDRTIDTIVINGDLKHEFGTISDQEWRHTLKFLDFLQKHCTTLVLVKGNHDTVLDPIAQKRNLTIVDHYFLNDILFVHGDKLPHESLLKKAKTIVIGHEHPSIVLENDSRREKYKCFFVGSYKRKKLIVLPSLNLLTEGSDLMLEGMLSPFLKQGKEHFRVFVVEDEIYDFGKLKDLT